jgi:hypothetical protein
MSIAGRAADTGDRPYDDRGGTAVLPSRPVERAPYILSGRELASIVLAVLPIFFFVGGPIWEHPFSIDGPVYLSYLPIPLLVGAWLAHLRKWTIAGFVVSTVLALSIKYLVTCALAVSLWAFFDAPKPAAEPIASIANVEASEPDGEAAWFHIVPTPIRAEDTVDVAGTLTDAAGRPISGAVAYVDRGLEAFVFAPPRAPVEVIAHPGGFDPPIAALEAGQPLVLRSPEGALHTVRGSTPNGAPVFNFPSLHNGPERTIRIKKALGFVRIGCTVHAQPHEEGALLVLGHPFHAVTGPDGAFVLRGVPKGKVILGAASASGVIAAREIVLEPGAPAVAALVATSASR